MKLNNIYLLSSTHGARAAQGWRDTCDAITASIKAMVWPEGSNEFRIPRIKKKKTNGTERDWRNGVDPIKAMFQARMREKKWFCEHKLSLVQYFKTHREWAERNGASILNHPEFTPITEILNEGVGGFDFAVEDQKVEPPYRTIVEWETGNISSSHRSLNKMCMALWAGLADAAVLIVPSHQFYKHLTDRIGNIRELQPYFYFYNRAASLADGKILAIFVIEHDSDFEGHSIDDYIPQGSGGNSKRPGKGQA